MLGRTLAELLSSLQTFSARRMGLGFRGFKIRFNLGLWGMTCASSFRGLHSRNSDSPDEVSVWGLGFRVWNHFVAW